MFTALRYDSGAPRSQRFDYFKLSSEAAGTYTFISAVTEQQAVSTVHLGKLGHGMPMPLKGKEADGGWSSALDGRR